MTDPQKKGTCCGVIDRFEGDWAVIEMNGDMQEVERRQLPAHARPGDAVVIEDGKIRVDQERTVRLRQEADMLIDELFEE
ncbi:DUF3006 domain-containing protein [Paenibacillus sp. ACRRX]|uniref:DUF3006 domain-containing protein n=1 Tax=Paenibacillus sp. ACRRX TaxID=2918206 RepID=UPI001EF5DF62|nr:DUF3006 domain-containing protein [Paenibacillus sp. ACRRX]MCG7408240.1 DUF3006 domain-containing protein [Paenibacillus sp. ACRRX]